MNLDLVLRIWDLVYDSSAYGCFGYLHSCLVLERLGLTLLLRFFLSMTKLYADTRAAVFASRYIFHV